VDTDSSTKTPPMTGISITVRHWYSLQSMPPRLVMRWIFVLLGLSMIGAGLRAWVLRCTCGVACRCGRHCYCYKFWSAWMDTLLVVIGGLVGFAVAVVFIKHVRARLTAT
jgi:hypothetical protein